MVGHVRGPVDARLIPSINQETLMRRWSFFVYGVSCHVLFVAIFVYMAGFVGNILVPKSLDSAPVNTLSAVVINLLLIGLFGVQHSIMARPAFKRLWTRLVPEPIERSTYVLISCIVTFLLMWQWQGLDAIIWDVQNPVGRGVLWGLFAAGWLLVFATSLMINHFDLFGTRQVWLYLRGRPYTSLVFRTPWLYKHMRHPLYVGWALAFWATPTMTLGHLIFAGTLTLYMRLAARFEERDLVGHFGEHYRAYQRSVPMFVPRVRVREEATAELPPTRAFAAADTD
jgi:protein-S-isoprenylcysteine O-methyltransferase Ste14